MEEPSRGVYSEDTCVVFAELATNKWSILWVHTFHVCDRCLTEWGHSLSWTHIASSYLLLASLPFPPLGGAKERGEDRRSEIAWSESERLEAAQSRGWLYDGMLSPAVHHPCFSVNTISKAAAVLAAVLHLISASINMQTNKMRTRDIVPHFQISTQCFQHILNKNAQYQP